MKAKTKGLNHYEFDDNGNLCLDCDDVFDSFHFVSELYEHRHLLALNLFLLLPNSWKCQTNKKWFLIGTTLDSGKQISYHIPFRMWNDVSLPILNRLPPFDGHDSIETLARLKQQLKKNSKRK